MSTFIGIKFPLSIGATSVPEQATDADLIRQSIIQLIMTSRRERVMRPSVGSNIYDFIFENNTALMAEMLKADITATIVQNEPRVILRQITVTSSSDTGMPTSAANPTINIAVSYVIALTLQSDTATLSIPTGA